MTTEDSLNKHEQPIRVLLVDDHDQVLWGLRKLIEGEKPRMMVTGTAKTIAQALAALQEKRPDVVVLDLFLGEENSLDHLPALVDAIGLTVNVANQRQWIDLFDTRIAGPNKSA